MIYIEYCLSDGTDKNTEIYYAKYPDNTHSDKFKSALELLMNHFYTKHCIGPDEDDDYFWKCKDNSHYCRVTKETAEED